MICKFNMREFEIDSACLVLLLQSVFLTIGHARVNHQVRHVHMHSYDMRPGMQ